MLAVTGSKYGNYFVVRLLRFFFSFFFLVSSFRANFGWIRVRVMVCISCISAIKTLSSS